MEVVAGAGVAASAFEGAAATGAAAAAAAGTAFWVSGAFPLPLGSAFPLAAAVSFWAALEEAATSASVSNRWVGASLMTVSLCFLTTLMVSVLTDSVAANEKNTSGPCQSKYGRK